METFRRDPGGKKSGPATKSIKAMKKITLAPMKVKADNTKVANNFKAKSTTIRRSGY